MLFWLRLELFSYVSSIVKLEMEVSSWRTGMTGTAISRAEQSIVMKEGEWQHEARLLYVVWVALKLCPETRV